AGPEGDLARGHGDGLAQPEAVAQARAVDAAEALALDALVDAHGGLATSGDGGEADGRLRGLRRHARSLVRFRSPWRRSSSRGPGSTPRAAWSSSRERGSPTHQL